MADTMTAIIENPPGYLGEKCPKECLSAYQELIDMGYHQCASSSEIRYLTSHMHKTVMCLIARVLSLTVGFSP